MLDTILRDMINDQFGHTKAHLAATHADERDVWAGLRLILGPYKSEIPIGQYDLPTVKVIDEEVDKDA